MQSYHGDLKLGPLFSKVYFKGPILKGKTSFLIPTEGLLLIYSWDLFIYSANRKKSTNLDFMILP